MVKSFDGSKYFQGIILSFLVVQIVSYLLHAVLGYPLLKLGFMFLLFGAIVIIVTLYVLGVNINNLDSKAIIFAVIVLGSVVALSVILPSYIPEIFSTVSIYYSEILKSGLGSVFTGGLA